MNDNVIPFPNIKPEKKYTLTREQYQVVHELGYNQGADFARQTAYAEFVCVLNCIRRGAMDIDEAIHEFMERAGIVAMWDGDGT